MRKNQYSQETVDGVLKVYDGGPSVVYGTVVLKNSNDKKSRIAISISGNISLEYE